MKSFMVTGFWFKGIERRAPEGKPEASGYEYVNVAVYEPCGYVVHKAESVDGAITQFWASYPALSTEIKPWINLKIDGKSHPRLEC